MKMPRRPPELTTITPNPDRLNQILSAGIAQLPPGTYLHWDKLRHKSPPDGFTREEWWYAKKLSRMASWRQLPLLDKNNLPFRVHFSDTILRMLHQIDQRINGTIESPIGVTDEEQRERYLISSLFEEAITSSQLEGAATTTRVAKDMLRAGRKPRDHSERMIYNNYQAMGFVREIANSDLTPESILVLHEIVTDRTLDKQDATGRWREKDEDIIITDQYDNVLHSPPPAAELQNRIKILCDFANEDSHEEFLHPVIKAILLHFMIGYDHPFVDGNGRTARALYYWYLVRAKYWLMEFVSISTILHRRPAQYARAYLYTETDDNDTTYFVEYNLGIIHKAIAALYSHLGRKAEELRDVENLLTSPDVRRQFNHRQLALLAHALKSQRTVYTIQAHKRSHAVTYQTARTDLLGLSKMGLLNVEKRGKAFNFLVPSGLTSRLESLSHS